MPPKFGTSGLRGLVIELTEALVRDYMRAFLAACPTGQAIHVGQDLRPSSPQIAAWVLDEVQAAGLMAVDCGMLPTPALALSAMNVGAGAVMITGSHIPADRNGLKFYLPSGEISKADEIAILGALGAESPVGTRGSFERRDASEDYIRRYLSAFGRALDGLRVGVYQHSSVARDIMVEVIQGLGPKPSPSPALTCSSPSTPRRSTPIPKRCSRAGLPITPCPPDQNRQGNVFTWVNSQ